MGGLTLFNEDPSYPLTRAVIASWAGARIHSAGWETGYSLNNPRDVNETVAKVQNGIWHPAIIHNGSGVPVAEHHLEGFPHFRNYLEGWAFTGGFVFEDFRGTHQAGIRADAWAMARAYFARQGFTRLFCVAFADNEPACRWIVECCDFHPVNRMRHAVRTSTGALADILIYSQRKEDCEEAAERAAIAFPEGAW